MVSFSEKFQASAQSASIDVENNKGQRDPGLFVHVTHDGFPLSVPDLTANLVDILAGREPSRQLDGQGHEFFFSRQADGIALCFREAGKGATRAGATIAVNPASKSRDGVEDALSRFVQNGGVQKLCRSITALKA